MPQAAVLLICDGGTVDTEPSTGTRCAGAAISSLTLAAARLPSGSQHRTLSARARAMQGSDDVGGAADSPGAAPRRNIIVKRLVSGHGQASSPLSMSNLRRKQLEKNNMQLALSRQRLAAERNRLKQDWRNEIEANLMLRQANCQLQSRLSQLEARVQKLEAASAQHAEAQLLADREAVAASRAAAAAAAVAATANAAGTMSSPASTLRVSGSESDNSTVVASPGTRRSAVSAGSNGMQAVQDWFTAQGSPTTDSMPQSERSQARSPSLFTTPPRVSVREPEPELFSPQAHDLTIVPPDGYAGRSRRRAALAASTNLVEPGLHSKMTQGMRKRNQLRARPGAYDDTWSADAASYMAHKDG